MEHHFKAQGAEQEPVLGAATGDGHLEANPRQQPVQGSSNPRSQFAQSSQASQQNYSADDIQRLREANAAFTANAEVVATTPRRTAWEGGSHPLAAFAAPETPQAQEQGATLPGAADAASTDAQEHREQQEWVPPLALGSVDADKIGPREAARRHMLQWDRIYEYNAAQNPDSLPTVERHRAEARRVYEALSASERDEDVLPKSQLPAYQKERIQARSALLRATLRDAPAEGCEPMKENITAALKGYSTGTIGFSETYTLIYAGQIVDSTARSYAEFTVDRDERLDRYFAQHGPGYLWWEPPLSERREQVLAKKGTCLSLDRELERGGGAAAKNSFQDDATHYRVPLGFKKYDRMRRRYRRFRRRSVVAKEAQSVDSVAGAKRKMAAEGGQEEEHARDDEQSESKRQQLSRAAKGAAIPQFGGTGSAMSTASVPVTSSYKARSEESFETTIPVVKGTTYMTKSQQESYRMPTSSMQGTAHKTRPNNSHNTENTGSPTIFFDMLLDSGAELPILLHDDFYLLGYTDDDMNAATAVELNAAAGKTATALCFELLVGLDLPGGAGAHSEAHFFPCRVICLPDSVKAPPHGAYSGERLSGMLPFLAYYMASAPGNDQLWMGEKRADVLDTENLPAGLAYDPFRRPNVIEQVTRRGLAAQIQQLGGRTKGLRKVTFETEMERGTRLIDEDVIDQERGEITTTIKVVDKRGELMGTWRHGPEQQRDRQRR